LAFLPAATGFSTATAQDSLPTADFELDIVFGCGPFLVQLVNNSSPNANTFAWHIDEATLPDPNAPNPIVQVQQAGTYNIQLIAGNAHGADTIVREVVVNGAPRADFSYEYELGRLELRTNNLSVNAFSFEWEFGDGSGSTQTNPVHTYSTDGSYLVRLVAFNDCGQDTFQQTVDVVTPPEAGFYLPQDTACAPFTVSPIDTSSDNADRFYWSALGANTDSSTQRQPAFTYTSPGTYTLVQQVANAADSSSVSRNLTVLGVPEAEFTINYSLGDSTIQLSNTSTGGSTYAWQFGDGQGSSAFAPSHTFDAEGDYDVQLLVANACGTDTATASVTIAKPPQAGFQLSAAEGCAPFTPVITNLASSNTDQYFWTAEGASPAAATGANPAFTYAEPGVYRIIQTVSNDIGSHADTLVLLVKGVPAADFEFTTNGASADFQAAPSIAESWSWFFGDGFNGTGPETTHVYGAAGTYQARLVSANECGQDTVAQAVKIDGSSPLPSILRSDSVGCVPLTVQFEATNPADSIHHWQWDFPGGVPAQAIAPSPTVKYITPGLYPVRLVASNPFGTGVDTLQLAVRAMAAPAAAFDVSTSGLQADFHDQSQGGSLTYAWNFGDGATSAATNPLYVYSEPGDYTVRLTTANRCGADETERTVSLRPSSQARPNWLDQLRLYPNPVTDDCRLEVQANRPARQIEASLFAPEGRLLWAQSYGFQSGQLAIQLPMEQYPPGLYTLALGWEGQRLYRQIIKQ
jgi:PKD repeat protein